MGQHKLKNRKPLAHRWILCTKWFQEIPTEKKEEKAKYLPMWTPIGLNCGIPLSYGSLEEAKKALSDIVNARPQNSDLLYCALEVKYVPSKIKIYKSYWFDKYVVTEKMLKIEQQSNIGGTFRDEPITKRKG